MLYPRSRYIIGDKYTVTIIIIGNHDRDYWIVRNAISSRLRRVQCNLPGIAGFDTRAFPHLPYFHLYEPHDKSICRHNETTDSNRNIHRERPVRKATRSWRCEMIPSQTWPLHIPRCRVRGFRLSNLVLCIFLLFAVRIVASLGAVCMRPEKNNVCDGADPL